MAIATAPTVLFHCEVFGVVEPKQSARFARRGAHVVSYQPERVAKYEAHLQRCFADRWRKREPIDEPVSVEIRFWVSRPRSRPKRCQHPDRKPDLDNLEKPVLDALERAGVIANDSRIVHKQSRKSYCDGTRPGVTVTVRRMVNGAASVAEGKA